MNPSTALAQVLVDAAARLGVRHAVLCPGSRSSALAYALAAADAGPASRLRLHVRVDERSAGFLALGLAKETGWPALVVTTSGTAVANLHPAVLEAAHAGVPLLVLSADRPHELRGTGANQTTDQVKLFGDAVRLFAEIPAPDVRAGQVRAWRAVMSRAVAAARGLGDGRPGPVHLNVAFREPLVPDDDGSPGEGPAAWPEPLTGTTGLAEVLPRPVDPAGTLWLPDGPRTVVLAGDGAGPVAAEVAAGGGWPLLAEPSSGARSGPLAIGPYRLLLDRPDLGGAIERVVVFGRPTLSRPVSRLLARGDVEVIVVSARPDWTDAANRAALVTPAARSVHEHPDVLLRSESVAAEGDTRWTTWLDRWLTASRVATEAVDAALDAGTGASLTGPLLAREVAASLRPGQALVAGSSNAVRDLDLAAHPFPDDARTGPDAVPVTGPDAVDILGTGPDTVHAAAAGADAVPQQAPGTGPDAVPVVLANRGLAGIDGTLATACGVALARAADRRPLPVRVLVGDLTFVHDANGLLSGPAERRPQVQVVLLDDAGGGIFGLLEPGARATRSATDAAVFERVFATPSGADLPALCVAVGARYSAVDDLAGLRRALAEPGDGVSVLHVRADRLGRADQSRAIADAVREAVDAALGTTATPPR